MWDDLTLLENSQGIIYWTQIRDNIKRRQNGEKVILNHNTYNQTNIQNNNFWKTFQYQWSPNELVEITDIIKKYHYICWFKNSCSFKLLFPSNFLVASRCYYYKTSSIFSTVVLTKMTRVLEVNFTSHGRTNTH